MTVSVEVGGNGSEPATKTEAEMRYLYFEELVKSATDLIEGRFVSRTEADGEYLYTFAVEKVLRGVETENTVTVRSTPMDIRIEGKDIAFSTYASNFEDGKSYLLLLKRVVSVFSENELWFVNESMTLPVDGTMEEMRLYGGALKQHIRDAETVAAIENGTISAFLLEKMKDNPLVGGTEYIASSDLHEIVCASDAVVKVTIGKKFMDSATGDRISYECVVEEVLKGAPVGENIVIVFAANEVEPGASYYVAVNEMGDSEGTLFVTSSRNSVYDTSCLAMIEEALQ